MFRSPKARTWTIVLLALCFVAFLVREVAREVPQTVTQRTEPIRENLSRLRKIMMSAGWHLDSMHEVNESEQIRLMQSWVGLFKDYLLPHLAAEEAVLFPIADVEQPRGRSTLTSVLRGEHEIMRRWIKELEDLANAPMPDHNAFARRGERLLGLIEAHFEIEEAVLFPLLDQAKPVARRSAGARR